eukprot:2224714-Prymnesium_polylepis.1
MVEDLLVLARQALEAQCALVGREVGLAPARAHRAHRTHADASRRVASRPMLARHSKSVVRPAGTREPAWPGRGSGACTTIGGRGSRARRVPPGVRACGRVPAECGHALGHPCRLAVL